MTITKESQKLLLLVVIAYMFSLAVRFIWVYQFHGYAPFIFDGQFMINTNDGYYFAQGANNLLVDPSHIWYHSPVGSGLSQLTYLFAKILPVSFETVLFYLSAFMSSLIVVPIMLISSLLKRVEVGFIAALLASVAWSYYNRTMSGYYDTDMLTIVLPSFILWAMIGAQQTKEDKYTIFAAIFIIISGWWYPQSFSLNFALFGLYLLYTLALDRKNINNFKLLTMMLSAMLMINIWLKVVIVLALYAIYKNKKFDKFIYYLLGLSIVGMFASGGFAPIMAELNGYVFRTTVESVDHGLNLHFFTVMQTIRESSSIPFSLFADRISGSVVTFLISLVGYVWLAYKYRPMLFALPMIGLGFLALHSGLRFTIYAIVPLALGFAYLLSDIARKMPSYFLQYSILSVGTILVLLPNLLHVKEYKIPTVFTHKEVSVLTSLRKVSNPKDYVVSWWDYGYPLRFYSHLRTLIDGGIHSGAEDYPVSYLLTHSQDVGARLARFDVEYAVKAAQPDRNGTKRFSNIEEMTVHNGFKNVNNFLSALKAGSITLPKKTRDIYIYLPFRMLDIYPTIALFSNLNPMNGNRYNRPLYFFGRPYKEDARHVYFQEGVTLNKDLSAIRFTNASSPINHFVKTWYDKAGKLHKEVKVMDANADVNVIYMASYGKFLIVDNATYNSLFVQLFVLQDYNPKLFKPIELTPYAAVYKLKI